MGAIPVDRKRGATITRQIIDEFKNREYLHLAIAPEGTRKRVERWKTGFHTIAKNANVSVYLGYFDWKTKQVGRGEKFEITDDAESDLKRIRAHYKKQGIQGRHPELFTTGSDLE